jgi:hypothetical protein
MHQRSRHAKPRFLFVRVKYADARSHYFGMPDPSLIHPYRSNVGLGLEAASRRCSAKLALELV